MKKPTKSQNVLFALCFLLVNVLTSCGDDDEHVNNHVSAQWKSSYHLLYLSQNKETATEKLSKLQATIKFENTSSCTLKNVELYSFIRVMSNTDGSEVNPYALLADPSVIVSYREEAFLKPGEHVESDVVSTIRSALLMEENDLANTLFPDQELFWSIDMETPKRESLQLIEEYFLSSENQTLPFINGLGGYVFTGASGFYIKWVVNYLCESYNYSHLYQGGLMYPVTKEAASGGRDIARSTNLIVYDYATKAPFSKARKIGNEKWIPFQYVEQVKTVKPFFVGSLPVIRGVSNTPMKDKDHPMVGLTVYINDEAMFGR